MKNYLLQGITLMTMTFAGLNAFAVEKNECLDRLTFTGRTATAQDLQKIEGMLSCKLSKIVVGKTDYSHLCFGIFHETDSQNSSYQKSFEVVTYEPGEYGIQADIISWPEQGRGQIEESDNVIKMTIKNKYFLSLLNLTSGKNEDVIDFNNNTVTRKLYSKDESLFSKYELVESSEYTCERLQ